MKIDCANAPLHERLRFVQDGRRFRARAHRLRPDARNSRARCPASARICLPTAASTIDSPTPVSRNVRQSIVARRRINRRAKSARPIRETSAAIRAAGRARGTNAVAASSLSPPDTIQARFRSRSAKPCAPVRHFRLAQNAIGHGKSTRAQALRDCRRDIVVTLQSDGRAIRRSASRVISSVVGPSPPVTKIKSASLKRLRQRLANRVAIRHGQLFFNAQSERKNLARDEIEVRVEHAA